MNKRVLVACFEIPGQGGAATGAYALFAKMRREGVDAAYLNIVDRDAAAFYEWHHGADFGNPLGLSDVHTCLIDMPYRPAESALPGVIEAIGADVCFARGFVASEYVRKAAKGLPLVLSTAGSRQAEFMLQQGLVDQGAYVIDALPASGRSPTLAPGGEARAIDGADIVVAGSDSVRDVLKTYFGHDRAYKVHDTSIWSAEWVVDSVEAEGVSPKPFDDRTYDVLFVSSHWGRHVKNFPGLVSVVNGIRDLRVVVAGGYDEPAPGSDHRGVVGSRREMFELMADTRVVALPSLWDACPTTLFEAAAMGCNVVTSKNAGNWRLCSPELLAEPGDYAGMASAIRAGADKPYPNGLDWFLAQRSYDRLLDILAGIAG